jgi:hypothetical protein
MRRPERRALASIDNPLLRLRVFQFSAGLSQLITKRAQGLSMTISVTRLPFSRHGRSARAAAELNFDFKS